ncbi:hypothetical protein Tco_1136422 [Tanacetum coccineum]
MPKCLLVPSFETAGLRPETDHLSPSYDLLKKGSFFTRSWASRNKIARSSILGPASDEVVNEEMDDSLVKAATTATGLDAEQDSASLGDQEDASKHGRKIDDINKDVEITLVDETQGKYGDDIMFDVSDLAGEEVFVAEQGVSDKDVNLSVDEVTLAQALAALKTVSTRPKAKGLDTHEQEQAPALIVSSQQPSQTKIQDKAEFDEQERIEREKAKANIALKETWDDIQVKIEADQLLAERLQAREQEELTIEERATLFQQLLEKRRKHFAAKRAEDKRNIPPTKAQQRSIMCSYLKNMEGWKPKDLKSKTELIEGSSKKADAEIAQESGSKRAGDELEQESIKKKKVDKDKETTWLKSLMEVIPDEEEVAVDAIPLATKPPSIVDWKIHKEGKKNYYQIIRADGSSKMYLVFSHMLKSFDREDLETLYKLVKTKYGSTRPVEDLDLVLYGDLKTMFDPYVKDQVWKNQSDYRVLEWKLYDSCGVHSLRKQNVCIHIFLSSSQNRSRINEVFESILLVIMKLLMKKLKILKKNIKFRGELLGLKDFLMILKLLLLRQAKEFKIHSSGINIRALVYAGVMTSGDARSCIGTATGFLPTYELTNIIVDLFEYHFQIMQPRMTTRSAGQATIALQGGRTGGRTGRGGGRTRGRSSDQGNGIIDGQGGQVGGQGSEMNDGVDGVPDFSTIIAQQLQNLLSTIVAQVGDQGRDQGNGKNQNGSAINDNIQGDVRNVIENKDRRGCTYKEFLACNPKEYDGKGGAIVYTR